MTSNKLHTSLSMADLPNQTIREIYQYWLDMKGDRHMPSRADLKPENIVGLLPHLSLIDVEQDTGRFKFRLMGSQTVDVMDLDSTGMYLDEIPTMDKLVRHRFEYLVKEKRPYLYFDKIRWAGKSFMDYYALGLPLSSNGETVDILMYGLYYLFPNDENDKDKGFLNLGF